MTFPDPASSYEKLKEFDSVPLFMRSLPDDLDDNDDVAVSALQSLVHDGTPDEIAQNFKEQGNDYFKGARYRDALGFYTQGIDAKPTDLVILEALLCNRAACNLKLGNYGSVLRDCSKAISLNPHSSKALYRSALALKSLDRLEESLDVCDRCLNSDAENVGVSTLREAVLKAKAIKDAKEAKKLEEMKKETEEKALLRAIFADRGLVDTPNPSGSVNDDYKPKTYRESDTTKASLILPIFFLYPQYAQSDIVSEFFEDTTFGDQLACMFPPNAPFPDWDIKHEYSVEKLVVFAITCTKRLLKIGMKMTLRDLCKAAKIKDGKLDGLEVRDGCLSIVALPKGPVEQEWVNEFKSSRDRS